MKLKILEIGEGCTGCGACVNICPKSCLNMNPDNEGFFFPTYDEETCIECRQCERVCHVVVSKEHPSPNPNNFFLYHSNDKQILKNSSSGGAFTLLSEWVLKQNGIVFGSHYNADTERLEVFHTDQTSLDSLRKSKYLESFTGRAFSEIKKQLKAGRRVLYCGTPCQVRGLKQYLAATNTPIDMLLAVDFACHGVPSNKYFRMFKQMFEDRKRKVVDVDFRHKDFSKPNMKWKDMTLRLAFSDGSERVFIRKSYYFYYYEPFLDNLFLRKSCYNCDIARHSDADITLGDFWGITKYRREIDDNKGISFVYVNNPVCLPLWKELSKAGFSEKIPFYAIEYQYRDNRKKRAEQRIRRDAFVHQIEAVGYKQAVYGYYGRFNIYKMLLKTFIKQLIGME